MERLRRRFLDIKAAWESALSGQAFSARIREMARETVEDLDSLSRDVAVNRGQIETLQAVLGPEGILPEQTRQVGRGFDDVQLTMRALLLPEQEKEYSAKLRRCIQNLQDSVRFFLKNQDIEPGGPDSRDVQDTTPPGKKP